MKIIFKIIILMLVTGCLAPQKLTLQDTFDEKLENSVKEDPLKAHMGFGENNKEKILFDQYTYFQGRHWKSHDPNSIELRFGKQGTEVLLCGSVNDCFEYSFYSDDFLKYPFLALQLQCLNDSTGTHYDLQIGFEESKKKVFHAGVIYLPYEQTTNWYYLDLRNLALQHPEFKWKKVPKLSFCVHTRQGDAATGSFLISKIRLCREHPDLE